MSGYQKYRSGTHSGRSGKFGSFSDIVSSSASSQINKWKRLLSGDIAQNDIYDLRNGAVRDPGETGVRLPSGPDSSSQSTSPSQEGWYDSNGNFWPAQAAYDYLGSVGNSSAKSWDYTNADIAKQYGMSKETAYQEAMANTAYQRSVKDMQDAGLNPAALFGAGRVSGADGVAYVTDNSAGAYGYTAAQSGSGYSRSSGKSSYALTNSQYNLYKLLGMGLGFAATRKWYGAVAGGNVAVQLMRLFNGLTQDK